VCVVAPIFPVAVFVSTVFAGIKVVIRIRNHTVPEAEPFSPVLSGRVHVSVPDVDPITGVPDQKAAGPTETSVRSGELGIGSVICKGPFA
jgi:hypothetical protein